MGNRCGHVKTLGHDLGEAEAEDIWRTSLSLTPAQDRGRHLTELSNQLRTPSFQLLAAERKGELQAGWT